MKKTKSPEERAESLGPGVDETAANAALPEPDSEVDAGAPADPIAPPVDFKDRWLRAEADLQNYRRRAQRDVEEATRFAEERGLLETISLLDDLERALDAAREAGAPESWTQGVQLVASRMRELLARQRVVPMDPVGEPFDPELHEALLEVDPTEGMTPGTVVQVVRKGYRRDQRALRPARVVVARGGAGEE